jgi:hypothetical protein
MILRGVAVVSLILLLWNPASSRLLPAGDQPIVLLDASLSMTGASAAAAPPPWRAALDSSRDYARRRAVVWRFGTAVTAFDSAPAAAGASHLAPALEAAAGRAGEVVVVTDGEVDDVAAIPADLLRRPRVIIQPRAPFLDAYVASVEGPRHITRTDTVRLKVGVGSAGVRSATLTVSADGRSLTSQRVALPDTGVLSQEITFPASHITHPGWTVLEVRIAGARDQEPRDDARLFALDVSLEPAAVIFASPPDWEARFLARTLSDVARVPVKVFVETEAGRWRDGGTLLPVPPSVLTNAAANARLVIAIGELERARVFTSGGEASHAVLLWPTNGQPGDWYVERPLSSPLTAALAGVIWDSLSPATAVVVQPHDSNPALTVGLTARLARRGPARPIITLEERNGARIATVRAAGLWRWAFRGGAAQEGYRSVVAALVDWLLRERGTANRERAAPVALEAPNGLPIVWRWTAPPPDTARALSVTLRSGDSTRTDTLRFDAAGRAELLLPPGIYRYAMGGGPEQGVVAVETYSDEWLPHAPALSAQPGEATSRFASIGLRDRWWLFLLAIAALATEWALRRRQGLP